VIRLAVMLLAGCAAGCGGLPLSTNEQPSQPGEPPASSGNAGDASGPFTEHEPLLPPEGAPPSTAIVPASAPDEKSASVTPGIEVQEVPGPPGSKVQVSWREPLEDVARRLKPYADRAPESLDSFSRLKLLQLKREALLVLLLSGRYDSEDCRQILEVFRKHTLTNVEIEALKFVLYQHLGEMEKRNEALESIEREARGKPQFRLEGVCFSEKVVGFRAVVPLASSVFAPGDRVQIYGEFQGAVARSAPGGQAEQQIQVFLSVLDEEGKTVDTAEFLSRADGTRRLAPHEGPETRSYFVGEYAIPKSLRPGRYQLRLSGTDLVAQTEAQSVLSFDVKM
jgi:hypothetical protein